MNLEKHMNEEKTSLFASHQWFEQEVHWGQFCSSVWKFMQYWPRYILLEEVLEVDKSV